MPGIVVEAVALARENQQSGWNPEGVEGVVQQVILGNGDADIVATGDHVRRGSYVGEMKDRALVVVVLRGLPGTAAEKISVVKGGVVIAPVGCVLHRASPGF